MKKILFILSFLGVGAAGLATAGAQYYSSYDYGNYTSSYTSSSYYPSYNSGSRASYTIGCTTYYYNPYTGASLGQQQVCSSAPVYTQPTYPSYPTYPTYPTYDYGYNYGYTYTQPSQYTTYGYSNGSWYPGYSNGGIFGSFTNGGYDNYNNYGCYYQNGYQVCY